MSGSMTLEVLIKLLKQAQCILDMFELLLSNWVHEPEVSNAMKSLRENVL